jgi:hypothetical protein
MNHPLHVFLNESIGQRSLSIASLVVDNARVKVAPSIRSNDRRTNHDVSSSHSRSSLPLQSLPSLSSESVISRWDSCVSPQNQLCPSPPSRPNRWLPKSLDNSDGSQCQPMSVQEIRKSISVSCQSPRAPTRGSSIQRPPCWEAYEKEREGSPRCARSALDDILGKALEECRDLEDAYNHCDEVSPIVSVV